MPQGHLFTTADVARAFGVGASTVKRWTEEGELEAAKTPGRHRRYTLAALRRFAASRQLAHMELLDALRRGEAEAVNVILSEAKDLVHGEGGAAAFLDHVVGGATRMIDDAAAVVMLTDAVDDLRPGVKPLMNTVLLACPPNEFHDFPLHLVRLVFEWRGWRSEYLGANQSWRALTSAVERIRPRVIALSARSGEPFRYTDFDRFVARAAQLGATTIVGGEWARGGSGRGSAVRRFRTLRGLAKWLR